MKGVIIYGANIKMHIKSFIVTTVLLSCMVPYVVCAADNSPFPDTGQTTCYDDGGNILSPCPATGQPFYGQDAQYNTGPSPKFQSNNDGTISNLNTGLMWQQKNNGTGYFKSEVIAYCEDLSLAGYSDWRLPFIGELQSIVNYAEWTFPVVNPAFIFDETGYLYFWSSTLTLDPEVVYGSGEKGNVGIHFLDGAIQYVFSFRDVQPRVICVRNGQPLPKTYVQTGNGSVIDNVTGLEWQQGDDGKLRTWSEALVYCEGLSQANHSDWRLPNILELSSIVDYGRFSPAINPVFQCNSFSYWSSTSNENQPYRAWVVDFINGTNPHDYLHADGKKGYIGGDEIPIFIDDPAENYVRCVRGGLPSIFLTPVIFLLTK